MNWKMRFLSLTLKWFIKKRLLLYWHYDSVDQSKNIYILNRTKEVRYQRVHVTRSHWYKVKNQENFIYGGCPMHRHWLEKNTKYSRMLFRVKYTLPLLLKNKPKWKDSLEGLEMQVELILIRTSSLRGEPTQSPEKKCYHLGENTSLPFNRGSRSQVQI